MHAVLNSSKFIQDKYSKLIYGTEEIPSKNFKERIWIELDDNGNIKNTYKLLDELFHDSNIDNIVEYITDPVLADGGAAMIAYVKMQFTEMSEPERKLVREVLLRYCKFDTLAMVIIWEYWMNYKI